MAIWKIAIKEGVRKMAADSSDLKQQKKDHLETTTWAAPGDLGSLLDGEQPPYSTSSMLGEKG